MSRVVSDFCPENRKNLRNCLFIRPFVTVSFFLKWYEWVVRRERRVNLAHCGGSIKYYWDGIGLKLGEEKVDNHYWRTPSAIHVTTENILPQTTSTSQSFPQTASYSTFHSTFAKNLCIRSLQKEQQRAHSFPLHTTNHMIPTDDMNYLKEKSDSQSMTSNSTSHK